MFVSSPTGEARSAPPPPTMSRCCFLLQFYWLNINEGYDGDVYLTVLLNGFIHTVMYTYYFVSMHTKDIWWKKYLTLMQVGTSAALEDMSVRKALAAIFRKAVRSRLSCCPRRIHSSVGSAIPVVLLGIDVEHPVVQRDHRNKELTPPTLNS